MAILSSGNKMQSYRTPLSDNITLSPCSLSPAPVPEKLQQGRRRRLQPCLTPSGLRPGSAGNILGNFVFWPPRSSPLRQWASGRWRFCGRRSVSLNEMVDGRCVLRDSLTCDEAFEATVVLLYRSVLGARSRAPFHYWISPHSHDLDLALPRLGGFLRGSGCMPSGIDFWNGCCCC